MSKGISFIMPVFNGSGTVIESLRSILETNFRERDEIIIVDDGSNDNTVLLVESFLSTVPRNVKLICHNENLGGASARNTAVEAAINDYIFCLDSDNILAKHSIIHLLDRLEKSGGNIACFGEVWFFKSDIDSIVRKWVLNEITLLKDVLVSGVNPISSGNYMYTKETWAKAGGYPVNSGALDAWAFGLNQLASGFQIEAVRQTGYFHRIGHDSYWRRESKSNRISEKAAQFVLNNKKINLSDESIDYLSTDVGRKNWMRNGIEVPLKIRDEEMG